MKTLLLKLFKENWQRKAVALLLGMIIWLMVNHSLTSTKVIENVSVRIINLPAGKTIEGMQSNGKLNKKLNLTVIGNTDTLNNLNANDLEVVIDASGKPDEWGAPISKKNLVSLNPEIDVSKRVSKVYHHSLVIRMTNLVTETIPIIVTHPIGEAPRGYQFLNVWPYRLSLTVSGPEDVIKRLKMKEQKITFNLSDISKAQLDDLEATLSSEKSAVVSFFVPDQWKQVLLPLLSDVPFELDENPENRIRIDFLKYNLIPLDSPVFISLFYPQEYQTSYNPSTLKIASNDLIEENYGIFNIRPLLYAKGSDRLFIETVKNRIQINLIVAPPSQGRFLEWGVVFITPIELENEYVSALMSDVSDEDLHLMNPTLREEYLRNRFRSYMNKFRLFTAKDTKFELKAYINGDKVEVDEVPSENNGLH